MTDTDILIEAHGLTRRYGHQHAVQNLSLTLRKGEVLGLLGPNGAGKSTTMKMLCGCLSPSQGEVPINGCLLYTSPSPRDRQKSRMPSSA